MTPEELSKLHPRLYHVTAPGAWSSISRIGLLPAVELAERLEADAERRSQLTTSRRPTDIPLAHPTLGTAILSNNQPLNEIKLGSCLDDKLIPQDWLRMLNERVFFWVEHDRVERLLRARANRKRARDVLVFDTLSLVSSHASRVQISPINSGATIHKPARRGLTTFTSIAATSYDRWREQRGRRDSVVELVVQGAILDIERHLIEIRPNPPHHPQSLSKNPHVA